MLARHAVRAWLAALVLLLAALPGGASAHPGWGIVEDRQGNIYYTDLAQVWRLAPDGRRSVVVPHVHTHELYLDSAGNLYGEHVWYSGEASNRWFYRVWRRSPDGGIATIIPPTIGFRKDYSFVRDGAGTLYFADEDGFVRKKPPGGAKTKVSQHRFGDIRSLTVSPSGIVHLIAAGALWRIDPDGATRLLASGLAEQVPWQPFVNERHRIMGLWSDPAGNIYAAIWGGQVVKRIAPDGRVTVAARSTFPWSPSGGLVDRAGRLWLLEYSVTNAVRARPADEPRDGQLWLWIAGAVAILAAPVLLVRRVRRARRV
jgi:hypothetical protein